MDVVVLIPHYNDPEGLKKILTSISTLEPVSILVVDDGSRIKPVLSDLKAIIDPVHEINTTYLEKNQGIEHALNAGLKRIHSENKYKYIARADCGDTNAPERFKIQKEFLDKNEDVYLISNYATYVDSDDNLVFVSKLPLTYDEIKRYTYYQQPIFHASAMFRTKAIDTVGYYPTNFKFCEDTAYFFKFIQHFKVVNLDKILYTSHHNPEGMSISNYRKTKLSRIRFSLTTFTFRYPFVWLLGLTKNMVCFIVGPKLAFSVAMKLDKK